MADDADTTVEWAHAEFQDATYLFRAVNAVDELVLRQHPGPLTLASAASDTTLHIEVQDASVGTWGSVWSRALGVGDTYYFDGLSVSFAAVSVSGIRVYSTDANDNFTNWDELLVSFRCASCTSPTLCEPGFVCAAGSPLPVKCPTGTYSPFHGNTDASADCLSCPNGTYCGQRGLFAPSGPCAAGYFCQASSTTRTPAGNECPVGYECPSGSSAPQLCPAGTVATDAGAHACAACAAGFFCDPATPGLQEPCPAGHYCPVGTRFALEFPCPVNTPDETPHPHPAPHTPL